MGDPYFNIQPTHIPAEPDVDAMKTTIEISDPLLKAARQAAKRDGTSVRALVEQGLRLALAERRRTGPFKLRDASVDGSGLQPGMDGLSWEAQRALAYGDREGSA